jgi:hypothetical protein
VFESNFFSSISNFYTSQLAKYACSQSVSVSSGLAAKSPSGISIPNPFDIFLNILEIIILFHGPVVEDKRYSQIVWQRILRRIDFLLHLLHYPKLSGLYMCLAILDTTKVQWCCQNPPPNGESDLEAEYGVS